jgi:hypothetical protein
VRRAPDADEGLVPRRRAAASAGQADGKVGPRKTIFLKKGTTAVKALVAGRYKIAVTDATKADNFHLTGPGVNKKTGVKFKGARRGR